VRAGHPAHGDELTVYPAISVIVCTRDRPQLLRGCLVTLARLDYPDYEVIVVDNASREVDTFQVVAATPFRYVREGRPGLNWARNRGACEARHEVIAYIDDDARADPGWLRGLALAFAGTPVAAVTGLVLPADLTTPAQRLFEDYSGMGKGLQARLFHRASMRPRELIAAHNLGVGTNMAFRRAAWTAVGGFDTALDVGTPARGAGDIDMFHRILMAGLWMCYQPEAIVRHHHRSDLKGLERQLYDNGCSFGVYLIRVWNARQVGRRAVARYAAGWLLGWVVGRLLEGLLGLQRFSLRLLWAELWGALHAPWAYRAAYLRDLCLRQQSSAFIQELTRENR
jgi:glycosyltransferase involved in cell wall biosynthesis